MKQDIFNFIEWDILGNFLKNWRFSKGQKTVPIIRIPNRSNPAILDPDDIENGRWQIDNLVGKSNAVKDIFKAISDAYEIEQYLLAQFSSISRPNPVVFSPPVHSKSDEDNFLIFKEGGVKYYYPRLHIKGSSLYPVFGTFDGNAASPRHSHPGTEILFVMEGQAIEAPNGGVNSGIVDLSAGELFHFSSLKRHFTKNKSRRKTLKLWAFREFSFLHPQNRDTILSRLLMSWRIRRNESLKKVAVRGKFGLKELREFEQLATWPFPDTRGNVKEQFNFLRRAYKIGDEILRPFQNKFINGPIRTSALPFLQGDNSSSSLIDYESKPGIKYYWPNCYLNRSRIHTGLLCAAPYCGTPLHNHLGFETILVLQGEAKVKFPDNRLYLESIQEGDLAQFDASLGHTVINTGSKHLIAWVLRSF